MRQLDLKKLLLPNLPYLLIGLYAASWVRHGGGWLGRGRSSARSYWA